jgi:hypothetical protein
MRLRDVLGFAVCTQGMEAAVRIISAYGTLSNARQYQCVPYSIAITKLFIRTAPSCASKPTKHHAIPPLLPSYATTEARYPKGGISQEVYQDSITLPRAWSAAHIYNKAPELSNKSQESKKRRRK